MKSTSAFNSVASNQQETYVRTSDDPYFDGMRRGDAAVLNKGNAFDFQGKSVNKNVPRSASDVGDRGSTNVSMKFLVQMPGKQRKISLLTVWGLQSKDLTIVYKLNMYLKARRDDVNSSVLGKFLHAITGPHVTVINMKWDLLPRQLPMLFILMGLTRATNSVLCQLST